MDQKKPLENSRGFNFKFAFDQLAQVKALFF